MYGQNDLGFGEPPGVCRPQVPAMELANTGSLLLQRVSCSWNSSIRPWDDTQPLDS